MLVSNQKALLAVFRCVLVSCLTFTFCGHRQHLENAHGLVAFVDAHRFHLLDVS